MKKEEFVKLVGQDVIVDYPFGREMQKWNMNNFHLDENGEPHHNRLPIIMEVFIKNASNPHKREKGEHSTHGGFFEDEADE